MKSNWIPTNQKPVVPPPKIYDHRCTYVTEREGAIKGGRCKDLTGANYFFCKKHAKVVD